jgi:endogenous inhibitor of DNA gyrase (YacG/DUF329 family)
VADPPCPICKKPAKGRAENRAFPFCSARCKQVELGKWLNEEYRVPVEEDDEDPEKRNGTGAGGGTLGNA